MADVTTTDVLYTTSVSQLCLASHVPGRAHRASFNSTHGDDEGAVAAAGAGAAAGADGGVDAESDPPAAGAASVITVKQYSLALASAAGPGMQAAVMRERRVMKSLSPMPFIPANLGWARDDKFLTVARTESRGVHIRTTRFRST